MTDRTEKTHYFRKRKIMIDFIDSLTDEEQLIVGMYRNLSEPEKFVVGFYPLRSTANQTIRFKDGETISLKNHVKTIL
jgi:hypothetical protein